jgi:hypothetical protein
MEQGLNVCDELVRCFEELALTFCSFEVLPFLVAPGSRTHVQGAVSVWSGAGQRMQMARTCSAKLRMWNSSWSANISSARAAFLASDTW